MVHRHQHASVVEVRVGPDASLPRSIRVARRFMPRFDGINSARAHLAARDTAADSRGEEQEDIALPLVISLGMVMLNIFSHRPPQRAFTEENDLR